MTLFSKLRRIELTTRLTVRWIESATASGAERNREARFPDTRAGLIAASAKLDAEAGRSQVEWGLLEREYFDPVDDSTALRS
jgi:hypothetical protein|tara:strand:+ start:1404 stop:1649 length:246 start_codon:yes stop_codon:yes gene_type:complete